LRRGTSFVFVATVAIMGLMLLSFPDVAQKPTGDIPDVMTPSREGSGAKIAAHSARLLVESQKGFANEPVRLGVSLVGAEGGEIVTVEGLADGADLSLGSLSTNGWQVSSADLDSTFVGPPKGFVGVMNAMVNLRSASGQLLQSQVLRFEWIEEPNPGPKLALAPPQSSQGDAPLDSRQIAALIKLAQGRLKAGDIASARLLLKPAANAGNAQAALDLGMTFDPDLLVQRGVLGIAPDAAQAREWYARAIRLGSPEAERHLKRLMSTPR
jgi:hypothetical protein